MVVYDLLEGIKDGYKINAKYDTQHLVFKTPKTVISFQMDSQAQRLWRERIGELMKLWVDNCAS